jgi:hypothetical protein
LSRRLCLRARTLPGQFVLQFFLGHLLEFTDFHRLPQAAVMINAWNSRTSTVCPKRRFGLGRRLDMLRIHGPTPSALSGEIIHPWNLRISTVCPKRRFDKVFTDFHRLPQVAVRQGIYGLPPSAPGGGSTRNSRTSTVCPRWRFDKELTDFHRQPQVAVQQGIHGLPPSAPGGGSVGH